ncbi:hypothetical protein ACFL5K_03275, partial [Gemmatimonadota bacterium]
MNTVPNEQNEIEQIQAKVISLVEAEKKKYGSGKNRATALSAKILKALDDNEEGDGRLFQELYRGKFCYDHSEGQWYRFNESFWVENKVNEAFAAVSKVVESYEQETQRQAKIKIEAVTTQNTAAAQNAEAKEIELLTRIKFLHTEYRRQHILTFAAAGDDGLGIEGSQWDVNPMLLGCANGVIDLKTGMLREGQPDDYIKTASPTEWKGLDTPSPIWEKFLLEVFEGDKETVSFLQRVFGYAITGKTT